MIKTILIFKLLILLALQPVSAAFMASASLAGQAGDHSHQGMMMDCEQMDPSKCSDMDTCVMLGHGNCDTQSSGIIPDFKFDSSIALNSRFAIGMQDYLQPSSETPQRPPRTTR